MSNVVKKKSQALYRSMIKATKVATILLILKPVVSCAFCWISGDFEIGSITGAPVCPVLLK